MQITKALFFELVTPTSAAMFAFELRNMVCQIFWPKAKRSKATRGKRVVYTPIIKKMGLPADQLKEFEETIVAKSLLQRWGTADEVARAARFLLSEDSSNITGTELIIDGGVRLN